MEDLDKQLKELEMLNMMIPQGRKSGPAVPPKPKKTQPQIPHSTFVKTPSEPSYSSNLKNSNFYSNLYQNALNFPMKKEDKEERNYYSNLPSNENRDRTSSAIYTNVPKFGTNDLDVYATGHAQFDFPPPPPPPPTTSPSPHSLDIHLPPPPDDLAPPPSPVSSSYSELRRAAPPHHHHHHPFALPTFSPATSHVVNVMEETGGGVVSSTNYESIYEPINVVNPRPSFYTIGGKAQKIATTTEEEEADRLTDLLREGLRVGGVERDDEEEEGGGDFYGICVKCDRKVIGQHSGCTAMDRIYHTKCFTCNSCGIKLQGKPFYSLDNKPFCEEDYLNTLEKCSVCLSPILDRILRATGKPYHPECFCCVVCGKTLDGIPFTVDASNRIHCIEDFHKKFAPRCCVCKLPIMPEGGKDETVRVVALDRSFHIQCYKCEDCGLILSSESEGRGCYPLDDHVLCKGCNAKRVQLLTRHMTSASSNPSSLLTTTEL